MVKIAFLKLQKIVVAIIWNQKVKKKTTSGWSWTVCYMSESCWSWTGKQSETNLGEGDIHQDGTFNILPQIGQDSTSKYHVTNAWYNNYTHKILLERIFAKHRKRNDEMDATAGASTSTTNSCS